MKPNRVHHLCTVSTIWTGENSKVDFTQKKYNRLQNLKKTVTESKLFWAVAAELESDRC